MRTASEMIKDLRKTGMSQRSIGERIGLSQPSIHRVENGGGIEYENGKALERLHADVVGLDDIAPKAA